jgi:hypothetical protein
MNNHSVADVYQRLPCPILGADATYEGMCRAFGTSMSASLAGTLLQRLAWQLARLQQRLGLETLGEIIGHYTTVFTADQQDWSTTEAGRLLAAYDPCLPTGAVVGHLQWHSQHLAQPV